MYTYIYIYIYATPVTRNSNLILLYIHSFYIFQDIEHTIFKVIIDQYRPLNMTFS